MKTQKSNKPEKDTGTKKVEGSAALDVSESDILKSLVDVYGKQTSDDEKRKFAELLSKRLEQEINKHSCATNYNVLIIFDNTVMVKSDSDRIYQAITSLKDNENSKPLLLILLSNGGEPGSAYLIGKLCRESSNQKFIVVIPRYAKSAATLLATAADEIHMGNLSELGPIDPQINGMPALGLKNSIEHIAELVKNTPESAQMFAKYLYYSIQPIQIGHYERAAESAEQYAVRLLDSHQAKLPRGKSLELAHKLVYEYKDHGFVIDKSEAEIIFGENIVKNNTDEYQLGNSVYNELSGIERIADILGYRFCFIGSIHSEPQLIPKK